MKKAVIYARVSSVGDRQTTDRQVSDLTTFATKNDIEVEKVFAEKISGGKRNTERPILLECVSFCIENGIDLLLCSELSRIGRTTVEVLKTIDELHRANVCVYIQNLNIYTLNEDMSENPIASMLTTILAETAKIEKSNIAYRLNSGREIYKANGGQLGRKVGSVKTTNQKKEQYGKVISLLKKGQSIRNTATLTGVSISTVQRVKKEFGL